MPLHINIEDLLSSHKVESERIEYKEGWNPDAIYRSIGAFANDFANLGGGYILIGVTEDPDTKTAIRPVKGLTTQQIGNIQTDMTGYNNQIRPYYAPKLSIEEIDNKQIIVLWVVAGNERPYEVPESITARHKTWKYFIRRYASSIEAKGADKEELIGLSNNIPFDDRANTQASIQDISMVLVQDHLRKIDSKLAEEVGAVSNEAILQRMALLSGPDEFLYPRNVGLMLFSEAPHRFFPVTQVEMVHFPDGDANPFTEYPPIIGPIQKQIRRTLDFLTSNILEERVVKPAHRAESIRTWNYPLAAIEETLVNAFYHRDYQVREPIEIRIYRNSLVFINHGGPDRSIQMQAFEAGVVRPRRYRNRRLGDFLKELDLTEGKATGIPTIHKALRDNGSPSPRFNTDDNRTFLEVELFVHPSFKQQEIIYVSLDKVVWNLKGIDGLLNELLTKTPHIDAKGNLVETDVSNIDGDIAARNRIAVKAAINAVNALDRDIARDIAIKINEAVDEKFIRVLEKGKEPEKRKNLLAAIGITNNPKNFDTYVKPLEDINWLGMTLPDKPTSPKQQYLTMLKGRIVLQLLNKL